MRVNRGLLGWGVFFIVAGSIPLLVQAGVLDPARVRQVWQLWPLVLIGIGLGLILQRTRAAMVGGLVVAATFGILVGGWFAVGFVPGSGFGACGIGGTNDGDLPAMKMKKPPTIRARRSRPRPGPSSRPPP